MREINKLTDDIVTNGAILCVLCQLSCRFRCFCFVNHCIVVPTAIRGGVPLGSHPIFDFLVAIALHETAVIVSHSEGVIHRSKSSVAHKVLVSIA